MAQQPGAVQLVVTQGGQEKISRSYYSRLRANFRLQNRYQIVETLAWNATGAVYRAVDLDSPGAERQVAIKKMISQAQDPQIQEILALHLKEEVMKWAAFDDPGIVKILDYSVVDNCSYVVMTYSEGRNLNQVLSQDQSRYLISIDQICQWGIEICRILSILHHGANGPVIFRDLKPGHIMLDPSGKICLVDLGVARSTQSFQSGASVNTNGYAPPEQYRGIVTPAADIYALGAILHHLLTREDPCLRPLFTFNQAPIRRYNPYVSEALASVIMRALAYDQSQRYSSPEMMRECLEKALLSLPEH